MVEGGKADAALEALRLAHLTEKLTFLSQDDKDWVIDVAEIIMPLISRGEWARLNLVELGSAPEIDRR